MAKLEFRVRGLSSEQVDSSQDQPSSSKTQLTCALSGRSSLARALSAPAGVGMGTILLVGAVYVSQFSGAASLGTPVSGPPAAHSYAFQPNFGGRRAGGGPNCDCGAVDFGLLTAQFRAECLGAEDQLKQLAAQGKLGLKVENGKLVAGQFCGSNSGPRAWPVLNGPAYPPPGVPQGQPCTPSGLVRNC